MTDPRPRHLLAALLGLLLVACPGPAKGPGDPTTAAWARVARRMEADPADGRARLEAARLSIFARNDPSHASSLLGQVVRAPGLTADANLLRTYLAWRMRDYPALMDLAVATIEADPAHPRAEVAAWFLEYAFDDHPAFNSRIAPWLERLIDERRLSAGLRRVAARILLMVREQQKDAAGHDRAITDLDGGLVEHRVACPFGLFPAIDFHRDLPPDSHAGALRERYEMAAPAPRERVSTFAMRFVDGWLRCPDAPRGGSVAFYETHVRIDRAALATIQAYSPEAFRVSIDGGVVLERDAFARRGPRLTERAISIEEGWHRVRVEVASDDDSPEAWVALTDPSGRKLAAKQQPDDPGEPLTGWAPAGQPPGGALAWLASRGGGAGADLEGMAYRALMLHRFPFHDQEGARAEADRLVAAVPDSADGRWILAEVIEADRSVPRKQRRSAARLLRQRAAKADPAHFLAHYSLGVSEQGEDRHKEALAHFDRAVELSPGYHWAHFRRFEVLLGRGFHTEARAALAKALALAPNSTVAESAADYWRDVGALDKRDRARALELDTATSLAPAAAVRHAVDRGDLGGADGLLVARARAYPFLTGPSKRRTELALLAGDLPRLETASEEWRRRDPAGAGPDSALAAGRWLGGDHAGAVAALDRALASHPGHFRLRRLRAVMAGEPLEGEAPDARALRDELAAAIASDPTLADWDDNELIYLLERRRDHLQGEGAGFREVHRIMLLQTKAAVDQVGEWRAPSGSRLLEMRTLKADGTVLEPELGQGKGDESFSGAVPGDVVEYRFVRPLHEDFPGRGFVDSFFLQFTSRPIWRGELEVTLPPGAELETILRHGAPPPSVSGGASGKTWSWRLDRVPGRLSEPYQSPYREWLPHVEYRYRVPDVPTLRRDRLLDRLRRGRRPTRALRSRALALTEGLVDPEAKARALFSWVRDNVRSDGREGSLQGDAAFALAAKSGNRALLLSALLRAAGVAHDILVARPTWSARVEPPRASMQHYSDTVIRVGDGFFLDPGRDGAPAGWLADPLLGAEAIRIADGPVQTIRLPDEGGDTWLTEGELTVSARGDVAGRLSFTGAGAGAESIRSYLPRLPVAQRRQAIERLVASLIPGVELGELETSELEDRDAPVVLSMTLKAPGALEARADSTLRAAGFFGECVSALIGSGTCPDEYLKRAERAVPMLTRPLSEIIRVSLRFEGASAVRPVGVPKPVSLSGPWGHLSQEWRVDGATLSLERDLRIGITRVPVPDLPGFNKELRSITRAMEGELVVAPARPRKPRSPPGSAGGG